MVLEGVGVFMSRKEVEPSYGQEGYNLREDGFIHKAAPAFGVLVSRWSIESHTFVVALTMEDVAWMTILPLFGEANVLGCKVTLLMWRREKKFSTPWIKCNEKNIQFTPKL